MMRGLILTFSTLIAFAANGESTSEKKIVCYFGSWAVYRHGNGKFDIPFIDPKLCTHLIYTFAALGNDGTIKPLDSYADLPDNYGLNGYGKFNKLREKNPSTKTLIAMGGWNEGSTRYSKAVSTAEKRATLADSIVNFVKKYNFDGFDLDWEYPNQRGGVPEDKENYVAFLKELRNRLTPEGLLLSIAVGASEKSASLSYIIPKVAAQVDFINLMTYDYHGAAWESVLGIIAPLYASPKEMGDQALLNVNASVHYWLKSGAPAEKIVLGVPFYGQTFRLADVMKTTPGSLHSGKGNAGPYTNQAGSLSYLEMCEFFIKDSWIHAFEHDQRVPYSYRGDQWVGYDDITSLKEKAEVAKILNLGGAMMWSIESDDFRGICGESYPLLKILNHVLRDGPVPVTKPPSSFTTRNPALTEATTSRQGNGNPNDVCKKEGYARDEQNCSKFYYCQSNGDGFYAYEYMCPAGLYFNLDTNNCDYPYNVNCKPK